MVIDKQSRATGPLFFQETGCPNKVLGVSGNWATANFEHCMTTCIIFFLIVLSLSPVISLYRYPTSLFPTSYMNDP